MKRCWSGNVVSWRFWLVQQGSREGSQVEVSKITIYLGWKFHSIGFLISKFEFWRRFLAGKSKFTNKKSDGMEFPFQMRIIFETSTRDPSLVNLKKVPMYLFDKCIGLINTYLNLRNDRKSCHVFITALVPTFFSNVHNDFLFTTK